MSNNKAGQPKRTAPPVTLWNADASLQQRTDSTRSMQRVSEIQEHLLFAVNSKPCIETQKALHAVCSPQNYQGTLLILIYLAGFINAANGETYVSSKALAERIGVDRDTTDAQLERLLDSGIVAIVGKHGRSYRRTITLPCDHLDIELATKRGAAAESSAESSAGTRAESSAGTRADTSPHYQNRSRTELEQQQSDSAADSSLAERMTFIAALNDKLPEQKHIKLTDRVNRALDSAADNCMPLSDVMYQVMRKASAYLSSGGIVTALDLVVDEYAATAQQRKPKAALTKCTGLPANVECCTKFHTNTSDPDAPVTKCPQREQTN